MTTRIHSVPRDDFITNKLYIRMNPERNRRNRKWLYAFGEKDLAAWMKLHMVGEGFDCDHPIVHMCGGVPLALLCMFSAMRIVREEQEQLGVHVNACDVQDMIEKQVKRSGIQNTPGFEPLVESLQLGYADLPHHMLKTCLLYCSIYPENYQFYRDQLVMRWVAEGFTYKVDEAEGYFEELCDRGLLMQQNHASIYQLNSMMRNFLRWKSHEDNFVTYSSDITSSYPCRIHRLCIDKHSGDDGALEGVEPFSGLDWSQIRSLVVFQAPPGLPFEKLERVRVLDLQFEKALGNHHVKDICGLLRVKHLFGLKGLGISELPLEIVRLHYLETLNVRGMWIRELPREIGRLKKLKNLYVSFHPRITELPIEIGDLQNLEILCMSGTDITELPREIIGRLKKLKTLDVMCPGLRELPREIGDLQHLETLDLGGSEGMTTLPREIGKLQHLKTLKACWTWITKLPSEIGNLQNLETLDLIYSPRLTELPREIGNLQNLERLLLSATGVVKLPREIGGLKKLKILDLNETIGVLPWEAGQLSKLEGVPECVRQAWKNSDLVSCVLATEILFIKMLRFEGDTGGLIVGTKHMHIPQWIKDHFNDLRSLDIRICKLEEEQDLKILREMPHLGDLTLRLEVVPRDPITISGEGFPRLYGLVVDSRVPPVVTFQEGAMPMLDMLVFEFQFYGGPPPAANKVDPQLGIKHLGCLRWVEFRCNEEWYGGAAESRSPCMSDMIDMARKEAQEHPNKIYFLVTGREKEEFAAIKESAQASSSGTSKIDDTPNSGSGEIQEEEETFPRNESGKVSGSGTTGEIQEEA
ncbi:Leucine-rich repeat-containing protein 1 [Triticum urartu]|nr:Leucine-rich repeat-containing protein 1 [Triticum urartu]